MDVEFRTDDVTLDRKIEFWPTNQSTREMIRYTITEIKLPITSKT